MTNANPHCKCILGKAKDDEESIVLCGSGGIVFTAYTDCPLHGDYVQQLVKSGLKGLSLEP